MTELEKIEYAKTFIDKLANGINPLDDTPIHENDIVNNVRLSRCFFFVSDVLRQVIEATPRPKKPKKTNFALTSEQLANFSFSQTPIPISEIAKRLNMLIKEDHMKKITHRDLTAWLVSIGILMEMTDAEEKTKKLPTEQGAALGIFTEKRSGQRGTYTVILYNTDAQSFIVDNLDAVLALKYNKA